MVLITKKVFLKWHGSTKNHYIEKGYVFTSSKEDFEVKVEDLTKGSRAIVEWACDYCQKIDFIEYKTYCTKREKTEIKKDCCRKCSSKKQKESNFLKYGVESYTQTEAFKEKSKITNLEKYGAEFYQSTKEYKSKKEKTTFDRYGVKHAMQNKELLNKRTENFLYKYGVENPMHVTEFKNKAKETNIERYGFSSPLKNEDIQKKLVETNRDRYGYDYVSQVPEIREKQIKTLISKYGGKSALCSPEIKEKVNKTLMGNGNMKASSQQRHIHSIIGGKLNYLESRSSLDIAFPKEKIYFEYDGGGHNLDVKIGKITQDDFDKKEQKRYFRLLDSGWKCIRMITPDDKLPTDEEIKSFIEGCYLDFEKDSSLCSIRWYTKENKIKKNYKRV